MEARPERARAAAASSVSSSERPSQTIIEPGAALSSRENGDENGDSNQLCNYLEGLWALGRDLRPPAHPPKLANAARSKMG